MADTVNSESLDDYFLRVARLEGHIDLPPFKKILKEHENQSNLRVKDEQELTVTLIGKYDTIGDAGNYIAYFYSAFQLDTVSNWNFEGHGVTVSGIVKDGVKTQFFGISPCVAQLTFTIKIIV